jgi:tRNA pseudouridine38-40 synthase
MARAGSAFIGRHDFRAFGTGDRNPVRTVISVRVGRSGRYVTIDVRAESFLRGQVRRMVGLLLEVGLGKTKSDAVRAALADPRATDRPPAAPAKGLCLRHVALSSGRRTGTETNGEREQR